MSNQRPSNPDDDDIIWHDPIVFDMAADLNLPNTIPVGGFVNDMVLLPEMVFDASAPAGDASHVILSLVFTSHTDAPSAGAQAVRELLDALEAHERLLGGGGLRIDRARSSAGEQWLTVALRPNDEKDAWRRLSALVEQLGASRTDGVNGTADNPAAAAPAGANLAALLNWQPPANGTDGGGSREAPDLGASCARVERSRMRFDLVLHQE